MSKGASAPTLAAAQSEGGTSGLPATVAPLCRAELNFVALFSALEGGVFGWAAVALPWQSFTLFSLLASTLAVAKAATTLSALFQPRYAVRLWRISAALALLQLGWVSWTVFTGGAYIAGLYGSLGQGLFAALLAIWGLCVLLTLPTSVWALLRTRGQSPKLGKASATIASAAAVMFVARSGWLEHTAHGRPLPEAKDPTPLIAELQGLQRELQERGRGGSAPDAPIRAPKSTACDVSPRQSGATLIATYARDKAKFTSTCIQADTLAAAGATLRQHLVALGVRFPLRVDLVRTTANLGFGPDWVRTFELRPGLDGVCLDNQCWSAWQLLIRDAFLENQPLSFVKDLKFGADQDHLFSLLSEALAQTHGEDDAGASESDLLRVETQSWTVTESGVHPERRMRLVTEPVADALPLDPAALDAQLLPSNEQVDAAQLAAQAHILEAQLDDGRFRYMLHPFTGERETQNFNLPRQAGTAYVLCELGQKTSAVETAIVRALELLAKHERTNAAGTLAGLSLNAKQRSVRLEDSALPLVAFLRCRERSGPRFDANIERLTRLVLATQRADGSLAPNYDLEQNKPRGGPEPLFGPGQASLALVLLERQLRTDPAPDFIDPNEIAEARHKLVRHVTEQHWPDVLYPFFFVEENWHCLSARAALDLERDQEYERFCLDYVKFKSRQILDLASDVDPLFVGGMGFGNVIPPHNTGSAGFGEALSAAIALKRARGEPIAREQHKLRQVLGFLVRQQWTPNNCLGCVPAALGAISEHTHSAITRIDFVQHAWAALGNGEQMLLL